MTLLLKDPDALLDYAVDWGAEYLNGDAVADSAWEVRPEDADGVTIVATEFDPTTTSVQAAGGVAGRVYRLINHVTLVSGLEDSRSIVLRVEAR
jgi:hypothetical protein